MDAKTAVLTRLDAWGIAYQVTEHPAVFTIGEMEALGLPAHGLVCKNLFLRDCKGKRHFLVVLPGDKTADLKSLAQQLGSTSLSFASQQRLQAHLGLHKGEVTPLGLLNGRANGVELVFDRSLVEHTMPLGVHPNTNTATVWLAFADLLRVVERCGNPVRYVQLD